MSGERFAFYFIIINVCKVSVITTSTYDMVV